LQRCRIAIEELAALSQGAFLGSIGEKAEVADAHEAVGQDVKQEATDNSWASRVSTFLRSLSLRSR